MNIDVINGRRTSDAKHKQSEEKENELISEEKALQEELIIATKVSSEESTRSVAILNNREFNEIDIAEVFITVANAKLTALKNQLIENSEKLNRLPNKEKK